MNMVSYVKRTASYTSKESLQENVHPPWDFKNGCFSSTKLLGSTRNTPGVEEVTVIWNCVCRGIILEHVTRFEIIIRCPELIAYASFRTPSLRSDRTIEKDVNISTTRECTCTALPFAWKLHEIRLSIKGIPNDRSSERFSTILNHVRA